MRCLSIAEALREAGEDVIFAMAEEEGAYLPKERGFETFILHSDYRGGNSGTPGIYKSKQYKGSFVRQLPGYEVLYGGDSGTDKTDLSG